MSTENQYNLNIKELHKLLIDKATPDVVYQTISNNVNYEKEYFYVYEYYLKNKENKNAIKFLTLHEKMFIKFKMVSQDYNFIFPKVNVLMVAIYYENIEIVNYILDSNALMFRIWRESPIL